LLIYDLIGILLVLRRNDGRKGVTQYPSIRPAGRGASRPRMLCGGTAINTFDELLNSDYDSNLIGFVKRERCSLGGCASGYWLGDPASAAAH